MTPQMKSDSLMVITGAGGFIGGHLVKYFYDEGFKHIRAVDKKPLDQWYQLHPAAENLCLDLDRLLHHGHILKCGPRSWRTGCRRNPPRRKSNDHNHGRPRENAATGFGKRFFPCFEEKMA